MISVLLAFSMMAQAQQIGGMVIDKSQMKMPAKEAKKKGKNDTLAVANTTYRITYQSKAVNDTLTKPYKYRDDEMRLDISADGVSKFYSYSAAVRMKLMREKIEKGDFDLRDLPKAGILSMEFYKNYPEKGKTLMLDAAGEAKCQIEEKMETPEWTILPDSSADIMGYPCQLAVISPSTRDRGNCAVCLGSFSRPTTAVVSSSSTDREWNSPMANRLPSSR